ncbi:protein translocase subunit SecF [Tomitella fengzijianii]|uniref:Protein-export membrane protein SecF n=1 Tax=Tomitella fengzijianii TaxID=2597660 RepID=A0A516X4H6_9ACTN|nr:protein translocase subunit SecF [Tomitella fengzijianii]QDQ97561.1 protein translocase subunit SecF [Tomitella fengzijianii]
MGENTTAAVKNPPPTTGGRGFFSKLYTGTGAFQIIPRRKQFYVLTGVVVLVCILSMAIRGFSFGIDFEGGSRITFPATPNTSTSEVSEVFEDTVGSEPVSVQTVGSGGSASFLIQAETLSVPQSAEVRQALFDEFQPVGADGAPTIDTIGVSAVSSTWGGEITQKAIFALVVFLVLVGVYIAIRFERDMAFAALLAVLLDLIVTSGIYSLVGFEVSPATVIGLLTILGYSLYDTVVVFDKVEENVEGLFHQRRRTYAEQANLAVNQTLMRSINTSLTTILPILSLMVIAVWMLGVGTLKDLALVLLIGITVGTYSSICTATPLLVTFKEMRGNIKGHNKKVLDRRARAEERAAAAGRNAAAVDADDDGADGDAGGGVDDADKADADGGERPRKTVAGTATKPRPGARPASKRRKRS